MTLSEQNKRHLDLKRMPRTAQVSAIKEIIKIYNTKNFVKSESRIRKDLYGHLEYTIYYFNNNKESCSASFLLDSRAIQSIGSLQNSGIWYMLMLVKSKPEVLIYWPNK